MLLLYFFTTKTVFYNIFDIPVIGSESILSDLKINSGVIAVGDAQIRKKIHNKINNIISNYYHQ